MPHEHKLVPLKVIQEDYKIYWCRDCGMVCEIINGKIYEMIPEFSKRRLLDEDRSKEKFIFVKDRNVVKQHKRLGKSLKEIKALSPTFLDKLLLK